MQQEIEQVVRQCAADLLECDMAEVEMEHSFGALGFDSLHAAELIEAAASATGRDVGQDALPSIESPAGLVRYLVAAPATADAAPVPAERDHASISRQLQITSRASLVRSLRGFKRELGLALDPTEDALTTFWDVHAAMAGSGGIPWNVTTTNVDSTSLDVGDRRLRVFSSYSYLGLIDHPVVTSGAIEACNPYGAGAHGVRTLLGDLEIHRRLERRIAQVYQREGALVFSSGYLANLGVLPALVHERDYVLMDSLSHVSLLQACQLSGATILRFRHNDIEDAEAAHRSIPPDAFRDGARAFLVADSVFSMDGDIFDLPRARAFCREKDVFMILDEAHGFGAIGSSGRGIEQHFAMPGAVDLVLGTLSKGIPSMGGFATGPGRIVEFLRFGFAVPTTFSSPLSPYHCGAALAALDIMDSEPGRLAQLRDVSDYLRRSLQDHGFDTGLSMTPIVPVLIGSELDTIFIWKQLFDRGFFTSAVIAPAVAVGKARLRLVAHAEHSREDIDEFVESLIAARSALEASRSQRGAVPTRRTGSSSSLRE